MDDLRKRLTAATNAAIDFGEQDWRNVGRLTGTLSTVVNHPRLLRALSWGDPDTPDNAVHVLERIVSDDPDSLLLIESYIADPVAAMSPQMVSTEKSKGRSITFRPAVFDVPTAEVDQSLAAVMMPFTAEFENVFHAINRAASACGGHAVRAKDIWEHSTVVQDIFSLIFRSQVVVCDFTGKNANVFYEAGIAHTLGKVLIPITQSSEDVPFDLRHHRYLPYLANGEGLRKLESDLSSKFRTILRGPF